MHEPGFFARLWIALAVFFRILADPRLAVRVVEARESLKALPPPVPAPAPAAPPPASVPAPAPAPARDAAHDAGALHMLAVLQREGRLVDFLSEDVSSFPDADVGAAARLVHDGCRKVLADYLPVEPLFAQGEGSRVTIAPGFDPSSVRLTGAVAGDPPFGGTLRHHGWRVAEVKLPAPPAGADARVVAPAEVEL